MWRVCLAFASHRIALYLVALLAINASLAPKNTPGRTLPILQPAGLLNQHFANRLMEVPEVRTLDNLRVRPLSDTFQNHANPYFWVCRLWMGLTGSQVLSTVFILSNLFFLLFLFELYKLLNLMVTTDITRASLYLAVFWPTSYELSLGSQGALICFLVAFCLRSSVEQKWLPAGIAAALLLVTESWFLLLLPLLFGIFWYVQRHFSTKLVSLSLLSFAGPVAVSLLFGFSSYFRLFQSLSSSAGGQIFSWTMGGNFTKLFQSGYAGQVVSFILFLVGAVTSAFSHANWMYRVLPLWLLFSVVFGTPLGGLASHLLIAAICLEGVASLSSPTVNTALQVGMWGLGIWEVFNVFR